MHIDLDKVISQLKLSEYDLCKFADKKIISIRSHFATYGFKKAVIGLSGGIDSAVSAALAVKALGPENVLAYTLPYDDSLHSESCEIAKELSTHLGISLETFSIHDIVEPIKNLQSASALTLGNACARARMMVLMHMATVNHALVLGTENKTEDLLAYYTIGGDNISHIEPIHDLYKVQIFQLANYLKLPDSVLNRAPSAELWLGQTDEQEIGASYEQIDNILFIYTSKHIELLDNTPTTRKIIDRYNYVAGKRECPKKL